MTTLSEILAAEGPAAAAVAEPSPAIEAAGARARVRARVAATERDGNSLVASIRSDVVNAWPWHTSPPPLAEVIRDRVADQAKVPGANPVLRHGWTVYNHVIAIPATAVAYLATWIVQHPARLALALLLFAVPLLILTA